MRDRKKPEEPQEEGSPAWMNTYGDMVTLVLTFFVLLFSFSTIDNNKWEEIVQSMSGMSIVAIPALDPNATEVPPEGDTRRFIITESTPRPSESAEETPDAGNVSMTQQRFDELYEKIKNHIEANNLGYILNVEYTDDYTILLRMSDSAFFDPGSADLDESSKEAISTVASILVEYTDYMRLIHIEGYTDNVPIHDSKYADNWDLSYGRANMVREFLMDYTDLEPSLLAVTAYGEYHPIASNDTPEGRAQNRRVDFVIESILKDE